jgi:hypothetical protein
VEKKGEGSGGEIRWQPSPSFSASETSGELAKAWQAERERGRRWRELTEERGCSEGADGKQRGRGERVLGFYMLTVVSVQSELAGNDSSIWAARWGRRRGLSPVIHAWSSLACSNSRGKVGFSLGAHSFGHGQDTSRLRRARRVCRGSACSMPCRTVCGARGMVACMLRNTLHALGVHGVRAAGSERGPWRDLRPVWSASDGWATRAVSREFSGAAAAAGLLSKLGPPTVRSRSASVREAERGEVKGLGGLQVGSWCFSWAVAHRRLGVGWWQGEREGESKIMARLPQVSPLPCVH